MPRSMTGYGRGNCAGPDFSITAELRSVNHRYADFYLRMPRELQALEERVRRLLQEQIGRGRVELSVFLQGSPAGAESVALDGKLAAAYCRALRELAGSLGLAPDIGLGELIGLPGVLGTPGPAAGEAVFWPCLEKALRQALDGLVEQRTLEGGNLTRDLRARLLELERLTRELAALVPVALQEQRRRLESRLQEHLGADFDRDRLLLECAVLVEKMDVHEEIVRLQSHLGAFDEALRQEQGPVGRRLDFIAQEIFREVNTVGSKAQDYRLAALVVEVKTGLEKMREQIQNIE